MTDLTNYSNAKSTHYHPTTDTTDLTGANTSKYNTTPADAYGTTGIADTGFGTATYGNTDISGYRSSNTDTYGGHRTNTGSVYDDDPARSSRYDEIIQSVVNNNPSAAKTTRKSDRDTGTGYGQGLRNTFDTSPGRNVEQTGYGSRIDFRRKA